MEYAIKFLQSSFEENNFNDVKKILVDYLNNCKDDDENILFLEEIISDEDDL